MLDNVSITGLLNSITEDDYQNISSHDWPNFTDLKINPSIITDDIYQCIKNMVDQYREDQKKADKFCALAMHGREFRIDGLRDGLTCCNKKTDDLKTLRQQLLSGEEPSDCDACWNLERIGIPSLRNIHNSTLDSLLARDIVGLYKDCLHRDDHPTYMYKIETSNLCNGMCVTCSSKFSTAWQSLEKKNGRKPAGSTRRMLANEMGLYFDQKYHRSDEIFPIDYTNAKFVNFFGGESTTEKTNFQILEHLIDHGNTDCLISFTTHGNFLFSDQQQEILSMFPKLHFNFSIDAIEKAYEYLRYPFSWTRLTTNIEWCLSKKIEISANWTLSNLNIFYFDDIKNWFQKNHINYRINPALNFKAIDGQEYSICSLSSRVKDIIMNKNKSPEVFPLLASHYDHHDLHYKNFLIDIIMQDQWKKISIKDYLPEFYEVIKKDLTDINGSNSATNLVS